MDQARTRWNEWLEEVAAKAGGYAKLAEKLKVHPTTPFSWLGTGIPEEFRDEKFAEVAGVDVAVVRDLIAAVRRERSQERAERKRRRLDRSTDSARSSPIRKALAHAAPGADRLHRAVAVSG